MNNAQLKITQADTDIMDLYWNQFINTAVVVINQQGLCNTIGALKNAVERKQQSTLEDSKEYKDLNLAICIIESAAHGYDLDGSYQTRRKAVSDVLLDVGEIEVMK